MGKRTEQVHWEGHQPHLWSPQGNRIKREPQNEVCWVPQCCVSLNPDDYNVTVESCFYKRKKDGGVEERAADKRFQLPFYFSNYGWIKEKLDQFKTENRSQACVQSVVSHLSVLLGINVSSPDLDSALHLALPLHTHDFTNSRHHMQSVQGSQETAAQVLTPPGHTKPKAWSSWSNGFLIKKEAALWE